MAELKRERDVLVLWVDLNGGFEIGGGTGIGDRHT